MGMGVKIWPFGELAQVTLDVYKNKKSHTDNSSSWYLEGSVSRELGTEDDIRDHLVVGDFARGGPLAGKYYE